MIAFFERDFIDIDHFYWGIMPVDEIVMSS